MNSSGFFKDHSFPQADSDYPPCGSNCALPDTPEP